MILEYFLDAMWMWYTGGEGVGVIYYWLYERGHGGTSPPQLYPHPFRTKEFQKSAILCKFLDPPDAFCSVNAPPPFFSGAAATVIYTKIKLGESKRRWGWEFQNEVKAKGNYAVGGS